MQSVGVIAGTARQSRCFKVVIPAQAGIQGLNSQGRFLFLPCTRAPLLPVSLSKGGPVGSHGGCYVHPWRREAGFFKERFDSTRNLKFPISNFQCFLSSLPPLFCGIFGFFKCTNRTYVEQGFHKVLVFQGIKNNRIFITPFSPSPNAFGEGCGEGFC